MEREWEEEEFVDGFNIRTVFGALFIGLVMMPGSIYLGLVAGQTMGPAAEWVPSSCFWRRHAVPLWS